MNQCSLLDLDKGKKACVLECRGGCGLANKLNAMGIRPGKEITKISDAFIGGPVTIKVDNTSIAIGHGMASRIMLEVAR